MALVAAHFETEPEETEPEERTAWRGERHALEWLEALPHPEIHCSDADTRRTVTAFVPVNDTRSSRNKNPMKAGLSLLPELRTRQARSFPVAVPHDPEVYFAWDVAALPEHLGSLEDLAAKVTRVGHSASLVHAWIQDKPPSRDALSRFEPTEGAAELRLRVSGPGRLDALCAQYAAGKRPTSALWQPYRRGSPPGESVSPSHTVWDSVPFVLRRHAGPQLPLEATLRVTRALRDMLMKSWSDRTQGTPPEWISGHRPDGSPSETPHAAFFPLPDVGHRHADGHLLGLGIGVPRDAGTAPVSEAINPLLYDETTGEMRQVRLTLGELGEWSVGTADGFYPATARALRPEIWTSDDAPSRQWATVTPLVFDRHPKKHADGDEWEQTETMIGEACEHIGLPAPSEVVVSPVSMFAGVPHSRAFPPLVRKDGSARNHTHAGITFEEPVVGPVLLGAGRYRGYGLCRPLRTLWEEDAE